MCRSRDGTVSLAFLLLTLTGCRDDDGNSFDDPPKGPSEMKSMRAMCRDAVAALASTLLALVDYDDGDRSWSDEPSKEQSATEQMG